MSKDTPNLPPVKRLSDGQALEEKEVREISTQPHIVTYEYNKLEFAIAVDPRSVTSQAEDAVQEIMFEMSQFSDIAPDAEEKSSKEELGKKIVAGMSGDSFGKMTKVLRRLTEAEIDMLVPAILGTNDPNPENKPTAENLKKGGKLAKAQLEALKEWWNPTRPEPSAETKTTENQKSIG